MIDEKLIQGSQVSPFFSKLYNKPEQTQSYQPLPSTQTSLLPTPHEDDFEDDIQLDAFGRIHTAYGLVRLMVERRLTTRNLCHEDLELLAQSNRKVNNYGSHPPPASNVGHYWSYQSPEAQPTEQAFQFFNGPQITPHQSIASTSSDIDTRDAPSPLARIWTGRTGGNLGNRELGMQRITETFHSQSTKREVQHHQSSTNPHAFYGPSPLFKDIPIPIRGIGLLSVRELPDNYRSLFHFPVFNAVQSKCFQTIYKSDDNMVLAAPTGSGKTVVMELAICRLLNTLKDEQFKVVYQAPTKSLCSERFRDWNQKFHSLGLQCAELTGDTDHSQLQNVQDSQIIITTPEKWDSMTRKRKDHIRLMQLVKLFLIDEVHTLKEARGATLEAVVARMKSIGSNVRFVALSATIPNSEDIATWLGKNSRSQHVPARREHFGEEFRPVKLQKFVYGHRYSGNDFAFDKLLNSKLADAIRTHSAKKPIMIFCSTRNSTVTTAKELARLWSVPNHQARMWKGPNKPLPVKNIDLKLTTAAGVAFHHAGLEPEDRRLVESGYLQGKISVICCTSTLAVGVNLPCHLVIIKNTVSWQDGCSQEYSDLEVMQMLGRAGRPQFDDSATAVILTRKERVNHYERLVSGSESLESCLHLNLIEHLNAEIGLGNVNSIESAASWLAGTFLFVRLRKNPTHYKFKEGASRDDEDEMLRQICEKDIKLLQECGLVDSKSLRSTPFGDAMSRYYIRYETMKTLSTMKPKSNIAQILAIISKAEEFREIRFRAGEKWLYKEINRSNDICYPINVDIALPAHKISLLIQSELGAVEFPSGEQFQKHKFTFQKEKSIVFAHVHRVIRCIIDYQVHLEDSVTVRNALELARGLAARVWDHSPLQMKQIGNINTAAVRKLVAYGIDSIETLEETEPPLIDIALSKNQAFALNLRKPLADFPKLRVSVKMTGKDIQPGRSVRILFKTEIAFMNEKCPTFFQRRPVYVCFVAETSDGRLIDFRRISATKLQRNYEILLSVEPSHQDECITCHVMCDEIAGTSRSATLKPELPPSCFSRSIENEDVAQDIHEGGGLTTANGTERDSTGRTNLSRLTTDDLLFVEWLDSGIIDDWDDKEADCKREPPPATVSQRKVCKSPEIFSDWGEKVIEPDLSESVRAAVPRRKASKGQGEKPSTIARSNESVDREHPKLNNGRWGCNHRCKEKKLCKHLCCREGLSNPPKATRKKSDNAHSEAVESSQLRVTGSITKKDSKPNVTDTVKQQRKHSLGLSSSTKALIQQLPRSKGMGEKNSIPSTVNFSSSDYGDEDFDDLPSLSQLLLGIGAVPQDYNSQSRNSQKELSVTTAAQDAFDLGDNWVDDEITSLEQPPLGQTRTTNDDSANVFVIDLVSPEPQEMFSELPRFHSCGGQKRKLTDRGATHDSNGGNKRAKNRGKEQGLEEQVFSGKDENSVPEAKTGENGSSRMVVDVPADLGGIDPALLNDFKDIVDLF
ncbi:Sec63 Brl domain-containing protein [Aspergillus desertorum]